MAGQTLAELLNDLFLSVRHPEGREYMNKEVAEEIELRSNGDLSIDVSSIGKIRAGQVKNPGVRTIEGLALFFGVDTDYFFPDLARLRGLEQQRRSSDELHVMLRSTGMKPAMREHLAAIIKALADQEQDSPAE